MTRLYLVRNARTDEGAAFEINPSLDDVGREQAEGVAKRLGEMARVRIISSPQRRALETAKPLARFWHMEPIVDPSMSLMPLPDETDCDRAAWLLDFMKSRWSAAPRYQAMWRSECLARLCCLGED